MTDYDSFHGQKPPFAQRPEILLIAPSRRERATRRLRKMAGYQPRHPRVYRAWNLLVAGLLFVLVLPLSLMIAAALFLTQGSGILYRGPRLGKNRTIFYIYKFRTLKPEAAAMTRHQVLAEGSNLETPMGRFLRYTRLDELPQLINVLAGNMNLMGPRPVRPEIADLVGGSIRQYDVRFSVKPGLVGYTQCLMLHGTPKRMRNQLNVRLCKQPASPLRELLFVGITGFAVLRCAFRASIERGRTVRNGIWSERRLLHRTRLHGATVKVLSGEPQTSPCPLIDINDRCFKFESTTTLCQGLNRVALTTTIRRKQRSVTANCTADIKLIIRENEPAQSTFHHVYLAQISSVSDFQKYKIQRYFLEKSVLL